MERLPRPRIRHTGKLGRAVRHFTMLPAETDPITSTHIRREERRTIEDRQQTLDFASQTAVEGAVDRITDAFPGAVVLPIHDTRPPRLEMPTGDDAA